MSSGQLQSHGQMMSETLSQSAGVDRELSSNRDSLA